MNVVVYPTTAEMRRAALRFRPGANPDEVSECGAVFQCASEEHPTYLGIMRLSEEFLGADTVVHESVHAALVYVQKTRDIGRLHLDAWSEGPRVIDNEEALAYSVHGIATSLLTELGLLAAS